MAENGVFAVQPRGVLVGNEELAAIGVRPGIGHREDAGAIVLQRSNDLVAELITRAATAIALGVAALDHEIGNHAMKLHPVVKRFALCRGRSSIFGVVLGPFGQPNEVRHGERRFLEFQEEDDFPFGSLHFGVKAVGQFGFLFGSINKSGQTTGGEDRSNQDS